MTSAAIETFKLFFTSSVINPFLFASILFFSFAFGMFWIKEWFYAREHKELLIFGVSLILANLFLMPFLFVSPGVKIVVTELNGFYSFSFLATIFSWIGIYAAILKMSPVRYPRRANIYFVVWFLLALIIIVYAFFWLDGIVNDNVGIFATALAIFVPIQILGIITTIVWLRSKKTKLFKKRIVPILFLIVFLLSFIQMPVGISCTTAYPEGFWFIALYSCNSLMYILQFLKIILLVIGFILGYQKDWRIISKTGFNKQYPLMSVYNIVSK